jgi:LPS-assembly protein
MMRRVLILLVCLAGLVWPDGLRAQALASLVADQITVDPAGRVTAVGNVDVFFDGTRLEARELSYARTGDRLTIVGPIRVTDPDGTVLLADQASLDRDLRNGVLVSARLVLDQQLQLAANEIARVDDRYTRLDGVVASSCEVCANAPVPLWEIRARRVIHDDLERQLYFEGAQFRVAGVPIAYFPRLRLPDPSVERASGFLIPDLVSSSDLGTGIKLPYFIALGDHADATLTPFWTTSTTTLEYRYRQLLRNGQINIIGAASDDDIRGERGYFFGTGELRLPRQFVGRAQLEFVSDPGYLFEYGYSDKDRLVNSVSISRVRNKDVFRTSVSEFRTLRESEIPIRDTLPDQFIEAEYSREVPALSFGGRAVATVGFMALERPSSADVLGRDVNRLSGALNWNRSWVTAPGIILGTELGLRTDAYTTAQDSNFDAELTRFVPRTAVELRWPMSRRTLDGGSEVLEPIFRIDISDTGGDNVPIEDSRVIEFDEANLFSRSRYPGFDGVEDGVRVALGASWQRVDPNGWTVDVALGRVANLSGDLGFGEGSGLEGDQSEWMLSGRLSMGDDFQVISRSLFDTNIEFTLSETRLDWQNDRFQLGTHYLFAVPEPSEERDDRLSEWGFDGSYQLNDRWTASADWRYDFTSERATRAGIGLGYRTECVNLALSVSRRFADSTSVDPTTEFGFRATLTGIGGRQNDRSLTRKCRG